MRPRGSWPTARTGRTAGRVETSRRVNHFPRFRCISMNLTNCFIEPFARAAVGIISPIQRMDEHMDTLLLLIAINLLIVPFLQEAEAQGRQLRRLPGLAWILRLAHVRRAHWFRPFCILAFLFLAGAAMRAQVVPVDVPTLMVHFMIMQVVLWAVVVLNVRKHAKVRSAAENTVADQADGHLVAPLLHRL